MFVRSGFGAAAAALLCCLASSFVQAADANDKDKKPGLTVYTPGEHSVSDRGAAVYKVPLNVPPGARGVQPALELQYNSQSGNGIFGMGVSLNGLSAITRCPRTVAQDGVKGSVNYDNNDRLCLDGQRLMLIAGSYGADNAQYRLEHDNFSRIIGKGAMSSSTSWIEVTLRDGSVRQYGNSSDSRILAQGTSTVASWALYRSIDTSQNYLEWRYTQNTTNGEYYPDRVLYTGKLANAAGPAMPTFAEVRFLTYGGSDTSESRPDQIPLYRAGSKTLMTKRIRKIQTYADGSLVREYRLDYDQSPNSKRSRLTQLTECAADGSCLQPTQLTWAASGTPNYQFSRFADATDPSGVIGNQYVSGNFRGEGRNLLSLPYDGWENISMTEPVSGIITGTSAFNTGGVWDLQSPNRFFLADFDGDGRTDYMVRKGDGNITVYGWNGSSLVPKFTPPATPRYPDLVTVSDDWSYSDTAPNRYFLLDVNADGRTDIVHRDDKGKIEVWLSTGSGFSTSYVSQFPGEFPYDEQGGPLVVMDINGDGYPDILWGFGNGFVYLGNGTAFNSPLLLNAPWGQAQPEDRFQRADVNGDGLDDLILVAANGGTATVYLSKGNGSFEPWTSVGMPFGNTPGQFEVVDLNGDGRDDLIVPHPYNGSVWIYLSNGQGFDLYQLPVTTSSFSVGKISVADFDGDGRPDIYFFEGGWDGRGRMARLTDTWPDVVRTVKDGTGQRVVFDYDYLSYMGSTTYVKDPVPAYPLVSLQYPMLVASAMSFTNVAPSGCYSIGPLSQCPGASGGSEPNPATLTTRYRYGGLMAEQASGRGLLGFRWIEGTQVQSGIVTTTTYEQGFPLTGLVKSVLTKQPSGGNLRQVTNTNGSVALGNGRYFTYLGQSVENSWDLDGSARPGRTLTNTWECTLSLCFGNLTQSVEAFTDGYSETRKFWYRNDTATNILGLPTRTEVTRVSPF